MSNYVNKVCMGSVNEHICKGHTVMLYFNSFLSGHASAVMIMVGFFLNTWDYRVLTWWQSCFWILFNELGPQLGDWKTFFLLRFCCKSIHMCLCNNHTYSHSNVKYLNLGNVYYFAYFSLSCVISSPHFRKFSKVKINTFYKCVW